MLQGKKLRGKIGWCITMKSNVIVYGLGKYFENVCNKGKRIEELYNIVGFSDRNEKYADTYRGYISPSKLLEKAFDFVVIASIHYREIVNDLVEKYSVDCEKIIVWEEEVRREDYNNSYNAQFVFGQAGEDYVIYSLLKEKGISPEAAHYVEVGVDNPFENNHTYFLHLVGAKGILVDANPESINLIKVIRKNQKVLNKVISNRSGKVPFYISDIPSLSSMDVGNIELNNGKIKEKIMLETISMNQVLAMQDKTTVLSIDLEGYDKAALESIDFSLFRPEIICSEVGKPNNKLVEYMENRGYALAFCNYINSIWKKMN